MVRTATSVIADIQRAEYDTAVRDNTKRAKQYKADLAAHNIKVAADKAKALSDYNAEVERIRLANIEIDIKNAASLAEYNAAVADRDAKIAEADKSITEYYWNLREKVSESGQSFSYPSNFESLSLTDKQVHADALYKRSQEILDADLITKYASIKESLATAGRSLPFYPADYETLSTTKKLEYYNQLVPIASAPTTMAELASRNPNLNAGQLMDLARATGVGGQTISSTDKPQLYIEKSDSGVSYSTLPVVTGDKYIISGGKVTGVESGVLGQSIGFTSTASITNYINRVNSALNPVEEPYKASVMPSGFIPQTLWAAKEGASAIGRAWENIYGGGEVGLTPGGVPVQIKPLGEARQITWIGETFDTLLTPPQSDIGSDRPIRMMAEGLKHGALDPFITMGTEFGLAGQKIKNIDLAPKYDKYESILGGVGTTIGAAGVILEGATGTPLRAGITAATIYYYPQLASAYKIPISAATTYFGVKGALDTELTAEQRVASGIIGGLGAYGTISESLPFIKGGIIQAKNIFTGGPRVQTRIVNIAGKPYKVQGIRSLTDGKYKIDMIPEGGSRIKTNVQLRDVPELPLVKGGQSGISVEQQILAFKGKPITITTSQRGLPIKNGLVEILPGDQGYGMFFTPSTGTGQFRVSRLGLRDIFRRDPAASSGGITFKSENPQIFYGEAKGVTWTPKKAGQVQIGTKGTTELEVTSGLFQDFLITETLPSVAIRGQAVSVFRGELVPKGYVPGIGQKIISGSSSGSTGTFVDPAGYFSTVAGSSKFIGGKTSSISIPTSSDIISYKPSEIFSYKQSTSESYKPFKVSSYIPSYSPSKKTSSVQSYKPSKPVSYAPSYKPSKPVSYTPSYKPSTKVSYTPSYKPSTKVSYTTSYKPSKQYKPTTYYKPYTQYKPTTYYKPVVTKTTILPPYKPKKAKSRKIAKKRVSEGFDIQIKKRGKWSSSYGYSLTEKQAGLLAQKTLKKTLAASARVVKSKKKLQKATVSFVPKPGEFRQYTIRKGVKKYDPKLFIQTVGGKGKGFSRLGTKSEVREIKTSKKVAKMKW